MASHFLDELDLLDQEREKLLSLGAKSPLSLLLRRKASPEAFDGWVGRERAEHIANQLTTLLSDEERAQLAAPPPPRHPLGARLGPPPSPVSSPRYDLQERAPLLAELEELRKGHSRSPETERRIAELEQKLNRFPEGK